MTRLSTQTPFVLLDDARPGGADARLFAAPSGIIEARSFDAIAPALDQLEEARANGLHAAGYIGYEAGFAFEARLAWMRRDPPEESPPLLWFGLFEGVERIAPGEVPSMLADPDGSRASAPRPCMERGDYARAFERIQAYIAAGDIYQANLTFACEVDVHGDPLALYARLRESSRAGYGGIVWTGAHWLLSLSPELFFSLAGRTLTARPMKGTAERLADPEADALARRTLRSDPKQRAENLMIVDLLRNDLSRVADAGSVAAPSLFHVESYPTVHQMTSTVTATLAPEHSAIDVLRAIYPCGSITGAPKIRAMEIIDEVEGGPRGPYTGSIGRLDPNGDAAFNVAIRTLLLPDGEQRARLGLGSGIVADSEMAGEWRECLAKGAFLTEDQRDIDLFETMRFDPHEGIALLDRHLARMKASARSLGFAFDRHAARNELQAATFRLRAPSRITMLLSQSGRMAIAIRPLPQTPAGPVAVAIAPRLADAGDFRLRHKTSDRRIYYSAFAAAEAFDVLLEDDEGYLTEGCITSLFVERDGKLLTPPLARGLLPGVLRAELIGEGRAIEEDLTRDDLARGFFIGNALRGLIEARLA